MAQFVDRLAVMYAGRLVEMAPIAEIITNPRQSDHHLALDDDIECAGRLVGDDNLGAQRDRDRNAGALLHAARELVRIHSGDIFGQADLAQQRRDASLFFAPARAQVVIGEGVGDLPPDVQHRI